MNTIKHEKIYIQPHPQGFSVDTEQKSELSVKCANVCIAVDGMPEAPFTWAKAAHNGQLVLSDLRCRNGGFDAVYELKEQMLRVQAEVTLPDGISAICQRTVVRNDGDAPVHLTRLACAQVTGIGMRGTPWFETDRFLVHYCISHWQGEGQWQTKTLPQLGLLPASCHDWEMRTFRLQSVGSWSTGEYYPLLILEDKQERKTYFFEREGAENWFIELHTYGGKDPQITVALGGGDETIAWDHILMPGETYTTTNAVYGVVKGGFDSAIRALTDYKRGTTVVAPKVMPTFNDYMNCLWAQPTYKRLLPLIDKAAQAGIQRYCMDDGWAIPGTWDPLEDRFGPVGFDGVIRYIISKGMQAGVWFEFERTNWQIARQFGPDFVERRNGTAIGGNSPKLNLRCKEAQDFLMGKIDRVYRAGVRYIKNDHNSSEGWGANMDRESPAQGLILKERAFEAFFARVYEKYPDLVIENCASGALRCDHGTLKHFALQSVSDQEDYLLFPSVQVGQIACMPPEKCGVWGYPYPCVFDNLPSLDLTDAQIASHADGRQTIFNMVTAMTGHMYLSGRIDLADARNSALIAEGISVYRGYMDSIQKRYPIFPAGQKPLSDRTFHALGLEGEEDTILALWALDERNIQVQLPGYRSVEVLYPACANAALQYDGQGLLVDMSETESAIMLKLQK